MTDKDQEFLLHCLNEMMEGHYRIMRALFEMQRYLDSRAKVEKNG